MTSQPKTASTFREQIQRYSVALISLFVALSSLAYNTWRNERTESNRNIRAAGFEITLAIADLHEVIFLGHYSSDKVGGDPRKGWALILAIRDLSMLMPDSVQVASDQLLATWQAEANTLGKGGSGIEQINDAIDGLRTENLLALESLR